MNRISGGFITNGWMPAERLEDGRMFTLQTEGMVVGLNDLLVKEGDGFVGSEGLSSVQTVARFVQEKEGRAIMAVLPANRIVAVVRAIGMN